MTNDNHARAKRRPSRAAWLWLRRALFVESLCALCLSVLVLTLFVQVIIRYVFAFPLTWSQEVVAFSFTWLCFLGSAVGVKYRGHIVVDFLMDLTPVPFQKVVVSLTGIAVVAFCALLAYAGYRMMLVSHGQSTPALGLHLSYVYAALPVSGALMTWYECRHILRVWRGKEAPVAFTLIREEVPNK